jgi:hypothetical protein
VKAHGGAGHRCAIRRGTCTELATKRRTSFLKKRSKKLLSVSLGAGARWRLSGEGFLLLFFKKEVLPFLRLKQTQRLFA